MRNKIIYFACFASFSSGCGVIDTAARTMLIEPLHFHTEKEAHATDKRHRLWAKAAWRDVLACSQLVYFSDDFVSGFESGYIAQLKSNMRIGPPPIPPRKYWKDRYRTGHGRQAVSDWFDGFRLGAEVARQKGLHGGEQVPSSRTMAMAPLQPPIVSEPTSSPNSSTQDRP